jgi:hypothetical protein
MNSYIPITLRDDIQASLLFQDIHHPKALEVFTDITARCVAGVGRHKVDPAYTPVHSAQTRNLPETFEALNTKMGELFDILPADVKARSARGAKLKVEIDTSQYDKLNGSKQVEIKTGKPRRNKSHAGRSRDSRQNNAVWAPQMPATVPINTSGLRDGLESGALIGQQEGAAKFILESSVNGYLPQTYTESISGRQYADGFSLQNIPREIRRLSLNGFEVDAENAHTRLTVHAANLAGYDATDLKVYADNTQDIRGAVQDALEVEYETAKQVLIAALYGATTHIELTNIITRAGSDPELLKLCGELRAIMADARASRKAILSNARVSKHGVINILGKAININSKPLQIVAHILQGYEALVLRAGVEGNDSVLSLEHDGWTQDVEPDLEEIQAKVKHQTGIVLPFKVKSFRA